MVITFVLPSWSIHTPIGGFKVVYEYANRLSERGHQINVVHPLLLFPREARLKQRIKRFALWMADHFLRSSRVKWFNISEKVGMLIVDSLEEKNIPKGDLIIATAWQTAEWVNRYGQDKGEKFYLIQHYENWSGPEERVKATWKMPLKKIVIARWLAEKAKEMGEVVVAHIPNGLDFNHFYITRHMEKRNPKRIGMLYHKYDWKGSKDGIAALRVARDKFPDLQAVLFSTYSPGPDVPDGAEFHKNPSPNKLLEIYNSCGIFISSSWYEGWSLPSAEAMACGCALATTDSLGVREYAFNEKTALISAPKNPEELAHNIIRLILNNNLRISLAESGHRFIKNFTWEKAVNEFEKTISDQK